MAKTSVKKREQRQQQSLSKNKQRQRLWIIGLIILPGVLLFLVIQGVQSYLARQSIGKAVPSLGRDHIAVSETHVPYNSDPPTSGPHAQAAPAGFYELPFPDENIVHNLEHGHVVIAYDCDQLKDCEMVKAELRRLVVNKYNSQQVMAIPRKNRDAPITLTAWQRIELLEAYDEQRLTAFIEAWRGRAPENVP